MVEHLVWDQGVAVSNTVTPTNLKIQDTKFWSLTETQENGCILWTGCKDKFGYGLIHRRKIMSGSLRAPRYAYYLRHGTLPEHNACHHCDTPSCVNPDHIFDGTHKENSDDKYAKGRNKCADFKGLRNPRVKITEDQVRQIKKDLAEGFNNTEIAEKYPVTHAQVSNIKLGKSWTHIV